MIYIIIVNVTWCLILTSNISVNYVHNLLLIIIIIIIIIINQLNSYIAWKCHGINALSQEICPENDHDCALAYGLLVQFKCATDQLNFPLKAFFVRKSYNVHYNIYYITLDHSWWLQVPILLLAFHHNLRLQISHRQASCDDK